MPSVQNMGHVMRLHVALLSLSLSLSGTPDPSRLITLKIQCALGSFVFLFYPSWWPNKTLRMDLAYDHQNDEVGQNARATPSRACKPKKHIGHTKEAPQTPHLVADWFAIPPKKIGKVAIIRIQSDTVTI